MTPTSAGDLAARLADRRWVRRREPFPHIVAQRVFTDAFYASLSAQFEAILRENPGAFARSMHGYDASGAELVHHRDGPLGIFLSREWHDLLAGLVGVHATGDVAASLHHHEPGGADGWPHNDLNPGWFASPPAGPDETRASGTGGVGYHHGTGPDGVTSRETVRAVSMLYYLANPPWEAANGGQTALFASVAAARSGRYVAVPPVNNTLVIFECTPFSWHAYRSATTARNSVVMWIHRDKREAVERWGEHSIVQW